MRNNAHTRGEQYAQIITVSMSQHRCNSTYERIHESRQQRFTLPHLTKESRPTHGDTVAHR